MTTKKFMLLIAVCFLSVVLVTDAGFAQVQTKNQSTQPGVQGGTSITIKGKISYMQKANKEEMSGYYVFGQKPSARYHIVNPNAGILDKLIKKGKTVTIEGYTTQKGVEFLYIEKIDGKNYSEGKGPAKKAAAQ